jgi:KUP system potassium uptake protein
MFGPIMSIWFSMIAILGFIHIADDMSYFPGTQPLLCHPLFGYLPGRLLAAWGLFFYVPQEQKLCTVILGHCGRGNIRISWIFVKSCLLINYFGQGASLLKHHNNKMLDTATINAEGINAFF